MPCLSDSPTDLKVVWVGVGDTKLQIEISLFSMCFGWNPDEGGTLEREQWEWVGPLGK